MIKSIFLILFPLLMISCNEEEPNLDQLELLELVRSYESDVEILVPPSIDKPLVFCHTYMPPCKLGYKVKIKGLVVTALYYEKKKNAKESAKSLRGYQYRNWAFDDVKDEPILERFFEDKIGALKRY